MLLMLLKVVVFAIGVIAVLRAGSKVERLRSDLVAVLILG